MAVLVRYRWVVLAGIVLGVAAGVGAYHFTPVRFTVNTLVYVGDPQARQTGVTAIQSGPVQSPADWQNLLRSFVVLEPVVIQERLFVSAREQEQAHLLLDAEVIGDLVPGRYVLSVDGAGGYRIVDRNGTVVEEGASLGPSAGARLGLNLNLPTRSLASGGELEFQVTSLRDAARGLSNAIDVQTSMSAYMAITTSGTDPAWSAQIVNAVTEQFVEAAADLTRGASIDLSQTLEQQLETARQSLSEAEAAFEAFERSTVLGASVGGEGDGASPVLAAFRAVESELERLESERRAISRALEPASDGEGIRVQSLELVPSAQSSSELTRALSELADQRAERRGLLEQYTVAHPQVMALDARIRTLEQNVIPSLAAGVISDLDVRIAEARSRRDAQAAQLREAPGRAVRSASLRREVERAEDVYQDVSSRYAAARLAAISAAPDVRVVDWAVPPSSPDVDRRFFFAFLAFLAFTGVGTAGPLLLDRMDRRVRSPEDVEWYLGVPVLGVVPHVGGRRAAVRGLGRDQAAEAFRGIRTSVLFAHGSAGPLVLTVSSPGAGDGKSFTVSNLAMAFAELGRRTVVVDADVRRGVQHSRMGMERRPGLTDFLLGETSMDAIVRSTEHPLLHVVPMGVLASNAPELLSSDRMQYLLAELKEEFDVILIDGPPLGAAADPVILGTLAGSMVMVVRSGSTDAGRAEVLLRSLRRFPVRVLGAVLNDIRGGEEAYYYGYLPGYSIEVDEAEQGGLSERLRLPGPRGS